MTTTPEPAEPTGPASPGAPGDPSGAEPPATPSAAAPEEVAVPVRSAVLEEAAEVLEQAEAEQPGALEDLDPGRRLLLVHAHPDDESIGTGVTMARYAAEGAHVTLVTCTLGEEGEVLVPELEHLAPDRDDALGPHRAGELATAMEALGVTDHRFLGGPGRWRDSGMMGEPTNDRPGCFWRADVDEAAALLVEVLREVRPQVVVTYDERGGYGHPDHVQAHRVTMRALELAADPAHGAGAPWDVPKAYWTALPRSRLLAMLEAARAAGDTTGFAAMEPEAVAEMTVEDDLVTTTVDGTAHVDAKMAAMRAHATQITVDGPFFALSNNLGLEVWAEEHFRLVRGRLGPRDGVDGREADLFAGLG